MDRRAFIGTFAGGLLAAPRAAGAQQPEKVYRIGVLNTLPVVRNAANLDGFRQGRGSARSRLGRAAPP